MSRSPLFLVFVVLAVAGCSSGDTEPPATDTPVAPMTAAEAAERGPYGVGGTTLELVDDSRPTAANGEFAGAPNRTLTTEVWYPAPASGSAEVAGAPADLSGGPYPLIIFGHGFSSFRRQSASYAQHLASHGYVVASPDFPGSSFLALGGARLSGVLDQPADVSFIIDALLAESAEAGVLSGLIDGDSIGVTGHSLGGLTAMLVAYGERRDERVDAILPISPPACMLPDDLVAGVGVPAMVVGGSSELIVSPPWIRYAYEIAGAPKYFVSIVGGDHIRFADIDTPDFAFPGVVDQLSGGQTDQEIMAIAEGVGGDAADCLDADVDTDELVSGERQRELLRTVALPFFDAYLKGDPAAVAFLEETLPTLAGVRFEHEAGIDDGGE